MEILQTIWNALTTENETLTLIVCSPLTFIEAFVSTLLFTEVLNIKTDKKKILYYVVIFSIIALMAIFIIPTPFNTIINILACPILVYFIFKTNILKSILAEIIPYIFFFIISAIFVTFLVKITKLPSDYFLRVPLYKFCFSSIMYLFTYLLYIIFNRFNINITLLDKMKKEHNSIIFINLIIRNYSNCTPIMYVYNIYK